MAEPTLILDRYEVGGFIGRGGMAEVFQGRDIRTGDRVAIKRLRSDLTYDQPELIERFWRESDVLRQLDHPNIVKLLDAGAADGQYYLIMQYVGGGTLADLLKRQPQLPLTQALEIALELADALARTHHLHIVHRDIKPTNILLTEAGTPRLTDFGLAFPTGAPRLTQPGIAVGTWLYLSPEVCSGAAPDERADVWSFGVTLYEMLSGRLPFIGAAPAAILRDILHSPLPTITQFRADVPPALDSLLQRMLARDAGLRLGSFRQIGAEIEAVAASLDTSAPLPAPGSEPLSIPIEVQWTAAAAPEPPRLLTKLAMPPPRPNQVARPRLLQALDDGMKRGHQFTLVSAPPGFGKTTLVSAWLTASAHPVAWLSLDENDNDPVHFLQYLLASLAAIEPRLGRLTKLLLGAPQLPSLSTLLVPLVNDLAAMPGVFLVLDDYHVITAERVHDVIRFLLDHLPRSLHLVIISREDPPLPLPRLRVRDALTQIRERDLSFTQEETAAFLQQTMSLALPPGAAERLRQRTEGWVAALQLAALALSEGDQSLLADFSGDHRYVMDYLISEVLAGQPPPVRAFLQRTSILDQLSAPLCDALLDATDSAALLEQLEHANLFLIPLDSRRNWYRYHALFADVLRLTLPAAEQVSLHQRAAAWFAGHAAAGIDAVRHALSAARLGGDYQPAVALIQAHIQTYLDEGQLTTSLGWLDALPAAVLQAEPDLLIYQAWVLVVLGELERGAAAIAAVAAAADALAPASRGRLRLAQGFLALTQGELELTQQRAREAASLLSDPHQARWQVMALWALSEAQERGAHSEEAIASLRAAAAVGHDAGNPLFAALIELTLANALNLNGQRRAAAAVCQAVLARGGDERQPPLPPAVMALCRLAELAYDGNDLAGAAAYQERAQALAEQLGLDIVTAVSEGIAAKILAAQGDFEAALAHVRTAQTASHISLADASWIDALEGTLYLRRGYLAGAQVWAQRVGLQPDQEPHYLRMEVDIVYARVLLAGRALAEAQRWIERIDQFAEARGYARWLISTRLLRAVVAARQGDSRRALALLTQAVQGAAPEAYLRPVLDELPALAALLPQVRHEAPAFVDAVLRAAPLTIVAGPGEMLSERELEVLRLLAAGLANAEIAAQLVLSLGTVKQHVNHIYEKLHVHSRTQAVAQARARGLILPD